MKEKYWWIIVLLPNYSKIFGHGHGLVLCSIKDWKYKIEDRALNQ